MAPTCAYTLPVLTILNASMWHKTNDLTKLSIARSITSGKLTIVYVMMLDVKQVASRHRVNGHALRALRHLSGKTQEGLAQEGQINHSYISRLERGERLGCNHDVLERIARALDVPVEALIAARAPGGAHGA